MQCPHCQAEIDAKFHTFALGEDPDGAWQVATTRCPVCDRIIAQLVTDSGRTYPAWPPSSLRPTLSRDVPEPWRSDYHTACQVMCYSEEAAAALARRLLARLLQEQLRLEGRDLSELISKAAALVQMPSYLKEVLDLFAQATHLTADNPKATYPDRLVPVEPGEAQWTLDVVESFLEFEFISRARVERRASALREKLGLAKSDQGADVQEGVEH
ncbi:MAG: hypothetical protein N3B14_07025 [Thermoleophilia bacterium]|nr:hypothetical protein [Thermoleophilia bacterium]